MIDGGILLMLIGAATMFAAPAGRAQAWRRGIDLSLVAITLRCAFPVPAPDAAFDALIAQIDRVR